MAIHEILKKDREIFTEDLKKEFADLIDDMSVFRIERDLSVEPYGMKYIVRVHTMELTNVSTHPSRENASTSE